MLKKKAQMLSVSERKKCEEISKLQAGLDSKRALVLLAVDQGDSQGEIAQKVGLTLGQVKYAVALFRKKKLGFFPADMLGEKVIAVPKEVQAKVSKINLKEIENVAKDKQEEKKADKKKTKKEKSEKKIKKEKLAAVKTKAKKKDKKADKKKTKKKDKAEKKAPKSPKDKSTKKKDKGKKSKKK